MKQLACIMAISCAGVSASAQATFQLPQDGGGQLFAITPDGAVAVGTLSFGDFIRASTWTTSPLSFARGLGFNGRTDRSQAYAITPDQTTAVGYTAYDPIAQFGGSAKWDLTSAQTVAPATELPNGPRGFNSSFDGGYGITADGTVVVGQSGGQAVRWIGAASGQPIDLAYSGRSQASAITPDGARIVGTHTAADWYSNPRAFTWTQAGGTSDLPSLSPQNPSDIALAVSPDGLTIAGYSGDNTTGMHLVRWTIDPGTGVAAVHDLGDGSLWAPQWLDYAHAAMSADASVIGGGAKFVPDEYAHSDAVIWTENTGLVRVLDLLLSLGVELPEDSYGEVIHPTNVTGISADGTRLVGNYYIPGGYDILGWTATIPMPITCVAPFVHSQPASTWACPTGTATFIVGPASPCQISLEWQVQGLNSEAPDDWTSITDGPIMRDDQLIGTASGVDTPRLDYTLTSPVGIRTRCIVHNQAGSAVSEPASLIVCAADMNCDFWIDLTDFFDFLNCFDQTLPCAETDGNPGIDLGDFFAFLNSFDQGCYQP